MPLRLCSARAKARLVFVVFVVDLQSSLKIIALQWCGAGRPATDGLPQAIVSFPPQPVSQIRPPSGQCGVIGPSTR